jgi:hypothetical protein
MCKIYSKKCTKIELRHRVSHHRTLELITNFLSIKLTTALASEGEPWRSGKVVADQEVTGSSRGKVSCKICLERLRTETPSGSDPSLDPVQNGSFMHQAALFFTELASHSRLFIFYND